MQYKLSGFLRMSGSLVGNEKDLEELVKFANTQFSKGGDGKIFSWKIDGDKLNVDITSSSDPKPHEMLIRLKKFFVEKLGKKLKLGVREIFAEKYSVEFETEQEPLHEFKIPFANQFELKGKKAKISFENLNEDLLQNNYIDKLMKLVNEKIKNQHYEGKGEYKEYVWEGKQRKLTYNKDPAEELEKIGWIKRSHSKGQWILGPEITALITVFKELSIENIYKPLKFFEMTFPKFEPWSIPSKSGHAQNIYPNAYFVFVPKKSDEKDWEEVMDHFKVTGKVDTEGVAKRSVSVGMMSYAQCPAFWPFLEGKILEEKTLPMKIYDWSGPTYRNESGGTHGLDRVEEFHRTETLWVAEKKDAIKIWRELKDAYVKLFDKVLDMEIKVARVAPWWMAHEGKASFKSTDELGTFDFDAYLPYRGDRKTEWLEIQNNSCNGEKYPKAFTVKLRSSELWSGCAGGSFERWVAAFLAQKGLDSKNWPAAVRKKWEEKIKGFKTVKFF